VPYFSLPFYRAMIERSGFGDDIEGFDTALQGGDVEGAKASISDSFLEQLAGIGSAGDAAAAVERYREAGASSPCIGAVPRTDFDVTLKALAGLAGG
jgi:hypothetical protein